MEAQPAATPEKVEAEVDSDVVTFTPIASIAGSIGIRASLLGRIHMAQEHGEEDSLLALERLTEESGARRWTLFQKLIAGLRKQLAEAAEGVSECKRKNATLDQQVIHERSAREAGHALVCADLQALAQSVQAEIRQVHADAKATAEGVITEASQREKAAEDEWRSGLQAQIEALQQGLRDEELARHREHKVLQSSAEDVRAAMGQEVAARTQACNTASVNVASVESRTAAEREERLAAQVRAEEAAEVLGRELKQACSKQEQSLEALRASTEKSLACSEASAAEHKEANGRRVDELVRGLEAKLEACRADLESKLAGFDGVEAKLQGVLDQASGQQQRDKERERVLAELAERVKEEREERRSSVEQATVAAVAAASEAVARETREMKASIAEHGQSLTKFGATAAQQEAEASARTKALEDLRGDVVKLGQDLASEREARAAACQQVATSEQGQRQDLANRLLAQQEEIRRIEEVRLFAERLAGELRAEREAATADLLKQLGERIEASSEKQRTASSSEFQRLDAAVTHLGESQTAALRESRTHLESQAQGSGHEVKAALDAHREFAEEMEREVRKNTEMLKSLTEGLSLESGERCRLQHDTRALCLDMQRIRGHLPLCFADFR